MSLVKLDKSDLFLNRKSFFVLNLHCMEEAREVKGRVSKDKKVVSWKEKQLVLGQQTT